MKLYSLFDKIGERHLSVTLADNDAEFVRSSLFAILMDYPIVDVQAYCIGTFDHYSGIVIPCAPRLVDWSCYQFPKTADSLDENYLTFDELREAALSKKKQFDEEMKDKKEDLERLLADVDKALKNPDLSEKQKTDLINYRDSVKNSLSRFLDKEVNNG